MRFAGRHSSFVKRNTMITDSLPKSVSWVLDVGSNTGETTDFLSEKGHVVLGLEKMEPEYKEAMSSANFQSAFIRVGVSPEFIRSSVNWDAILLLSVLHRLYAFEGEEFMKSVLFECGQKTDNLFVEGSTRHARYIDKGSKAPGFEDLDTVAAAAWHENMFKEVLGPDWIVPKAISLENSEREPIRLFYHLRRNVG